MAVIVDPLPQKPGKGGRLVIGKVKVHRLNMAILTSAVIDDRLTRHG